MLSGKLKKLDCFQSVSVALDLLYKCPLANEDYYFACIRLKLTGQVDAVSLLENNVDLQEKTKDILWDEALLQKFTSYFSSSKDDWFAKKEIANQARLLMREKQTLESKNKELEIKNKKYEVLGIAHSQFALVNCFNHHVKNTKINDAPVDAMVDRVLQFVVKS